MVWTSWWFRCLQQGRPGLDPWVGKISWRRQWQPSPVFLPGKSNGQRSLVGYSPCGRKESDTTEQLHFHFSFIFVTLHNYFIFQTVINIWYYSTDFKLLFLRFLSPFLLLLSLSLFFFFSFFGEKAQRPHEDLSWAAGEGAAP